MAIHKDEVGLSDQELRVLTVLELEVSNRLVFCRRKEGELEIHLEGDDGLRRFTYYEFLKISNDRQELSNELEKLLIRRFERSGWTVRKLHGCLVFT